MVNGKIKQQKALEGQPKAPKFSNGNEVHTFLRFPNNAVSNEGLKSLRNQLTSKPEEGAASNDERLRLVKEWLEISPGAQDVFALMENQNQPATIAICLSILACILSLTSGHVNMSLGQPIVKRLLTSQWMRKLDSQLTGIHHDTSLAALKLLNAISAFAGGKEQKTLMESFSWDAKLFHKLLYMRRKGKESSDLLLKPDIRTLTIQFILSFVSPLSPSYVKTMLLEQHRDVFLSIFKILGTDPYSVLRFVLETLWTNIWLDQKVKRTLKIGLFGETTIQRLLKIYDRSEAEGTGPEDVPADLVHHFMLALCTHRGSGICFADNGWYPRQDEDSNDPNDETMGKAHKAGGKIYNKILANVLKMLQVNDDPRQQELAFKILTVCPELVSGYLTSVGLTLEPRLSSKWLANIAFLGSVVSLPVPVDSFLLPLGTATSSSVTQYRPTPPPLWAIMENALPSLNLKVHLTKAIQSTSALVQHSAAIALAKCLQKCESILESFDKIERALGEDSVTGQWARRRQDIEKDIRKRVPDFQVIIAFSNAHAMPSSSEESTGARARAFLMAEVAQRLMWLYHRCCPSLVAEARYDIAKSLVALDVDDKMKGSDNAVENLLRLHQLHVINMLRKNDQFVWHAKTGAQSNIHVLLQIYVNTTHGSIRDAVMSLITQTLKDTQLFQHDPEELTLWLDALPKGVRGPDAETPDGTKLTDERESVLTILDDCLLRCGRTPYRYIEDLDSLLESSSVIPQVTGGEHLITRGRIVNASPLLATLLEQLGAKLKSQLLAPSEVLALATYIRKVAVGLLGKQWDTALYEGVTARLSHMLCNIEPFPALPVISGALRKEVALLRDYGDCCKEAQEVLMDADDSPSVDEFLTQVEQISISEEGKSEIQAYELVDWLRILDKPLSIRSIRRLMKAVLRFYPPALSDLFENFSPKTDQIWDYVLPFDGCTELSNHFFRALLLRAPPPQMQSSSVFDLLKQVLGRKRISLYTFKNYCGLLLLQLKRPINKVDINVLQLLTHIIKNAKETLVHAEFASLQQYMFSERMELRHLSCQNLSSEFLLALTTFLNETLDSSSESDRVLVIPICKEWVAQTKESLGANGKHLPLGINAWLKYIPATDILDICELALQRYQKGLNDHISADEELTKLINHILEVIIALDTQSVFSWLNGQLPTLVALRRHLRPFSKVLDQIIARSLMSIIPLGFDGMGIDRDFDSLLNIVRWAERHWKQRASFIPQNVSLQFVLQSDVWSSDDCDIVKAMAYLSSEARSSLWAWIRHREFSDTATHLHMFASTLKALLDNHSEDDLIADGIETEVLAKFTEYLALAVFAGRAGLLTSQCIECIMHLIERYASHRVQLLEVLIRCSRQLRMETVHPALFALSSTIERLCPKEGTVFISGIVSHSLQWAARSLSEDGELTESQSMALKELASFIADSKYIAPQYAEPVLTTIIRNHLTQPELISFARTLFNRTKLKPASVNKLLQSILQHSQFSRIADSKAKDAVLRLTSSIFHSHPSNTCQPSHILPLIQQYTGSLSVADRLILTIMHLFEAEKKTSVASLLSTWSPTGSPSPESFLDVICSLEPGRVLRTILSFPSSRVLAIENVDPTSVTGEEDGILYDPVLLQLLLAHSFIEGPPQSALSWVQLYRSNIISLTIRCLSATDYNLRLFATQQLSALWKLMQSADMQEKEQVLYILNLLRDQLPSSPDDLPVRLPSYVTLFLAHALRGIFYPSNFIYPITARFLLQRPELDLNDVPLLFGLLYSSTDDWKKERAWIVRFLADGMQSSEDWRLLKRRHTWDLLASLFESSFNDKTLRHGILEFMANLSCHPSATTSLILKSSFLQWMEIQLVTLKRDESIAWAKIIENVLVIVDTEKVEKATGGEWKSAILRCLKYLLQDCDIALLRLLSRTMCRIVDGAVSNPAELSSVLEGFVAQLVLVEETLDTPIRGWSHSTSSDALPPHRSQGLHRLDFGDDLHSWGCIVEYLWRVSMSCDGNGATWGRLNSRLLVWRAIVGERGSPVGEWARKQTVSMLLH